MSVPPSRPAVRFAAMPFLLFVVLTGASPAQDKKLGATAAQVISESRAKLDAQLDQPVTVDLQNVPLHEAVVSIADDIGADVMFDNHAVEDAGLTTDDKMTIKIERAPVPARKVLELMLDRADLVAVNNSGILYITTQEDAEVIMYIRVYDVRDIIEHAVESLHEDSELEDKSSKHKETRGAESSKSPDSQKTVGVSPLASISRGGSPGIFRNAMTWVPFGFWVGYELRKNDRIWCMSRLASTISRLTDGPWERFDAHGGTMGFVDGRLVIRHTDKIHRQIQQILDGLRRDLETVQSAGEGAKKATREHR